MVDATPFLPGLSPVAAKSLTTSQDAGNLSSNGGLVVLREAARRLDLAAVIADPLPDTRNPLLVTHSYRDMVTARMMAIAAGYEDGDDLDALRRDPAMLIACERAPESGHDLPSQPTISRLENLADVRALYRIGIGLVDLFCESFVRAPARITLDIDDTSDMVHGQQELALFNTHAGGTCFQPIHIFEAGSGKPVLSLLRPGKRPSGQEIARVLRAVILIYCISKLVQMRDEGRAIGPCVRLTTHDMLVETNRPTNNLGYERLLPALNRLRGVVINTTIRTGNEMTTRGFGLIDEFEYNRKGSMFAERLRYLEIRLSDWLYRAVAAAEVLPISRNYFRLRRPIDRRLYEIARKHCGRQASWRIGTELLQKKCGSRQLHKHFAAHLRTVVRQDHLPDYALALDNDQAVFHRRREARQPAAPIVLPSGGKPEPQRRPQVSQAAIEELAGVAPGWDRYALEAMYLAWVKDKDPARNEDARFLAWARNFTKGRPPS